MCIEHLYSYSPAYTRDVFSFVPLFGGQPSGRTCQFNGADALVCVCAQPVCMAFFNGVNTQTSANPLNATDIANLIGLLFDNPNGMVSFWHDHLAFTCIVK